MQTTDIRWQVDVPEGECRGVKVQQFEVTEEGAVMSMFSYGHRAPSPGTYTKLLVDGHLWMSDTAAEVRDHYPAVRRMRYPDTRRVLINGLGLGMVVKQALALDHVESVDIVELDDRVIELIGPHYEQDPRVHIHHADAYRTKWPAGTTWDVAWHDIWENITSDNLPLMAKLHRSYGRRVKWQGSWCFENCRRARDRERRESWWRR